MLITLSGPETLRIVNMADAYDWLAALTGSTYDKASRSLTVRLCNLRRIVSEFPQAQVVDRDGVIAARVAQWGRWVAAMNESGIHFAYLPDARTVSCTGLHVAPALCEWVQAHTAQIEPWLGEQALQALVQGVGVQGVKLVAPPAVEPTHGDRLILTGIQNAHKAAERKAAIAKRKWKKLAA